MSKNELTLSPASLAAYQKAEDMDMSFKGFLASLINDEIKSKTPLGRLLSYVIDVASDEFLSEEYYNSRPELMEFLVLAGSNDEELRFRNYKRSHAEVFTCKSCSSSLDGGCPLASCPECGKTYYMIVDKLSQAICNKCAAQLLGECTEEKRNRNYKIFSH